MLLQEGWIFQMLLMLSTMTFLPILKVISTELVEQEELEKQVLPSPSYQISMSPCSTRFMAYLRIPTKKSLNGSKSLSDPSTKGKKDILKTKTDMESPLITSGEEAIITEEDIKEATETMATEADMTDSIIMKMLGMIAIIQRTNIPVVTEDMKMIMAMNKHLTRDRQKIQIGYRV